MRNALAPTPVKQRTTVAAMLKTVFAEDSKAEAVKQSDGVADIPHKKQPKLGALMDALREDMLACIDFRREHWAQTADTDPLERVNKEIERRSDVVGIVPNDDAIIRRPER